MAEANTVQPLQNITDVVDHQKKGNHQSSTHTAAINQLEYYEAEREYIVGWRLYLLTFRFWRT